MAFSDQFISEEEAFERFKQILTSLPGYEKLADSQIAEGMSRFQSWALRQANWRTERVHQEGFLSTAGNRASVLAHAESRQYLPRKPTPSTGPAVFVNTGDRDVSLPAGTQWVSDNGVPYQSADDLVVPAGSHAFIGISQLETQTFEFTISERTPFYEITLSREESTALASFDLYVDGEQWTYYTRLMNTDSESLAYDEFHTALDEIGIRFGNGIFGRMPASAAAVRVEARMTQGQTELLAGQTLTYVAGSPDPNIGMIEAQTSGPITGGRPRESIEEVRRNALYYPLYDEQLVWRDDFSFAIRRMWPEAIWVNVWGEQEQEAVYGPDLDNIGTIFVSAYSPERPDVLTEIVAGLEKPINREYRAVATNFKPFAIRLEGEIARSIPKTLVENDVRAALKKAYGKDSPSRKESVLLKDMYKLVSATGHFEAGDFTVEIFGDRTTNGLNDYTYLDFNLSQIEIAYP